MDLGRFRGADEVTLIYFWLEGFGVSPSHLYWLSESLSRPSGQQGAWSLHNPVLASAQPLTLGFASVAGDTQLAI